jgi:hypothetical protein
MSLPETKDELLNQMESARAALEGKLEGLSVTRLSTPGADGWAIKDHITHLGTWQKGIAALLRKQPRYVAMGLDLETVQNSDIDQMNALIDAHMKKLSAPQAISYFRETYQDLLDALAGLSDEDLQRPYSYYQPDEPGKDAPTPIMSWIAGNTYDHYSEHIEWIDRLLK